MTLTDLADFTEEPIITKGGLVDLDMESIGFERYDKPGKKVEGIYELWGKNGTFVYRNVRGYYSWIGRGKKMKRLYFENLDHILNTVMKPGDATTF